jgi:Adenosylmethionine-8-amino-7-oxononanoate aminotransferase
MPKMRADGAYFEQLLRETFANHPHVGDIRGRGFFWGVELVADRDTKAPLDSAKRTHARVKREAMQRGLLCYPMGGTVDGKAGDHVLLAPPFIASRADLQSIAERLKEAIDVSTVS